jgi:hypothetical protein
VAARAGDRDWSGWMHAVCASAVECLDTVEGATITLVHDSGVTIQTATATDPWALELSRLDIATGGPSVTALKRDSLMISRRLVDDSALWPEFVPAATGIGLAALAAYPLTLSRAPFGVLTLYRRDDSVHTTRSEEADAAVLAELAVSAVVADLERLDDMFDAAADMSSLHLISAAVRGLTIRQSISDDSALNRLRAHALLTGRSTVEVARQVLRRTIRSID